VEMQFLIAEISSYCDVSLSRRSENKLISIAAPIFVNGKSAFGLSLALFTNDEIASDSPEISTP